MTSVIWLLERFRVNAEENGYNVTGKLRNNRYVRGAPPLDGSAHPIMGGFYYNHLYPMVYFATDLQHLTVTIKAH